MTSAKSFTDQFNKARGAKVADIKGAPGSNFERGDHVEIADHALRKLVQVGEPPVLWADGEFYRYAPSTGKWSIVTASTFSLVVQSFAGARIAAADGKTRPLKIKSSDVKGAIDVARAQCERESFFREATHGVLFRNGFVQLVSGDPVLLPHSPSNRARFGYEFDYQEAAEPEIMLSFLRSIYRDDADCEARVACDQEFFGACLMGLAPRFQRCMVKVNENGNNGKGTLQKIIDAMMPPDSVGMIPPQTWANEYYRAKLAGKLVNMVGELPNTKLEATSDFKGIIAGDRTSGRHPRGEPFDYLPLAGHMFSANGLPGSADLSDAFWRRMIVMRMTRSFKEGDPDRDPQMAEKVIADRALIVPWLIQGAARAYKNKGYSLPPSHHEALEEWRRAADNVRAWFHEKCEAAMHTQDGTMASVLLRTYRQWAESEGYRNPVYRNAFAQRLKQMGLASKETMYGTKWNVRLKVHGNAMATNGNET